MAALECPIRRCSSITAPTWALRPRTPTTTCTGTLTRRLRTLWPSTTTIHKAVAPAPAPSPPSTINGKTTTSKHSADHPQKTNVDVGDPRPGETPTLGDPNRAGQAGQA